MTAPAVLVVRAQPGADDTAKRIGTLGLTAIVSPALVLKSDPAVTLPDLDEVSGLVFTSANGVRFFTERSERRDLKAWCVGPATAEAARQAGFADIGESAGNAIALADFICRHSPSDTPPLLHIANAAAKGDLRKRLEESGRAVIFCALYRADRADALSSDAVRLLESGDEAIVLLHSAKGAAAFLALASAYRLDHLSAAAISEPVGRAVPDGLLSRLVIADEPNEESLMEALQRVVTLLA